MIEPRFRIAPFHESEMIVAGARVRLVSLPDWTLSGLPEEEQAALKAFVGGLADVTEVDAHGYVWIASGR